MTDIQPVGKSNSPAIGSAQSDSPQPIVDQEASKVPEPKDEPKSAEASANNSWISKLLSALNQPFIVTVVGGAMVFLVTGFLQQQYWLSQQRYLIQQENIKSRLAATDEIMRSVDELLSGASAEFTAYESNFSDDQKTKIINKLNAANEDWEKESDLRKLRIQLYFPDKQIQDAWGQVDNDLEKLDCYTMRLPTDELPKGYGCEDVSEKNLNQSTLIAKGRSLVELAQNDLQTLAKLMIDAANKTN
jgi:hypothetical protein